MSPLLAAAATGCVPCPPAGEQAAQRAAERAGERALERAAERAGERAMERAGERVVERAAERAGERAAARAGQRAAERAVEHAGERAVERAGGLLSCWGSCRQSGLRCAACDGPWSGGNASTNYVFLVGTAHFALVIYAVNPLVRGNSS